MDGVLEDVRGGRPPGIGIGIIGERGGLGGALRTLSCDWLLRKRGATLIGLTGLRDVRRCGRGVPSTSSAIEYAVSVVAPDM